MTALLDTIALALGTLRVNVLRSALTLLGIVIGTSTVVAMMSLTEGLRLKIQNDFTVLGAGAFQISRFPAVVMGSIDWRRYERRQPITREQGEALQALPHVRYVSVEEWGEATWTVSTLYRSTRQDITVGGVGPEAEPAHGGQAARGRFIGSTDVLLGRRVAFLGADVADVLFPGQDPVGQEVRIRGASLEVIGVAQRMGSIFGESKDGFVCLPWTTYEIVLGKQRDTQVLVGATAPEDAPRAIDETIAALRRVRGVRPYEESDFEVFTNDTLSSLVDNLAPGGRRRDLRRVRPGAPGGWHRHHEHHAGVGDRADAGDRHPQGPGRPAAADPGAVPGRVGDALGAGRGHRGGAGGGRCRARARGAGKFRRASPPGR